MCDHAADVTDVLSNVVYLADFQGMVGWQRYDRGSTM